jgi:hypothetical protein
MVNESGGTFQNLEVDRWWGGRKVGDPEEEKWGNRNSAPTIYVAL